MCSLYTSAGLDTRRHKLGILFGNTPTNTSPFLKKRWHTDYEIRCVYFRLPYHFYFTLSIPSPPFFFLRTKTTTNIGTLQATMRKRSDQTAMDELELKVKLKRSLICAFAKAAQ